MQASDSRKRAAEGDGGMVQVPAELVETLTKALDADYTTTSAHPVRNAARALVDAAVVPESTEAPEMAQRCDSVAPSGIPAPTVPRIARSVDDLRVGMVVAVSGPFGSGVVRTVERVGGPWVTAGKFDTGRKIHPEDVANGYVFILSEPPVPTLPTTPGSVIEAAHPRLKGTLWFRSAARGWVNTNDRAGSESNLTLVRVLFDAGADA